MIYLLIVLFTWTIYVTEVKIGTKGKKGAYLLMCEEITVHPEQVDEEPMTTIGIV